MVKVRGLIKGLKSFHKDYNYLVFSCIFVLCFLIGVSSYGYGNSNVFAFQPTVSSDINTLIDKGTALDFSGNHNEAIAYFDKALEIDPNNESVLFFKANALDSLGRYNEAITYYDKALEIDPNDRNAVDNKNLDIEKLNNGNNSISNSSSKNTFSWDSVIPNTLNSSSNSISSSENTTIPSYQNITTGDLTYTDSTYGISITYPSDWTKEEGSGTTNPSTGVLKDVVTFIPTKYVNVSSIPVVVRVTIDTEPKHDLDGILKDEISAYKHGDFKKVKVISSDTQSTLSGQPAYSIMLNARHGDITAKILETGTMIGSSVYYILYEVDSDKYDTYLPVIQNLIKSFKITNPP